MTGSCPTAFTQPWQIRGSSTWHRSQLRTIGAVGQVSVGGALINLTDSIKNLGLLLNSELTFNKHVSKVCQSSYFHVMAPRWIRGLLSSEVAVTVACVMVWTRLRLNYCNSILYGTLKNNISRLQCAQNTLAYVVTQMKKFDHITSVFRRLHWLPIQQKIEYKVALLAFKVLRNRPVKLPKIHHSIQGNFTNSDKVWVSK